MVCGLQVTTSELSMVRAPGQHALHLTECCLQVQKWCPYKGREVVPEPVCANKVRNGLASSDQQPAKAAAMYTAPHAETRPPPPILPFLLAQNLSSKGIAPTDNMRPKSDDTMAVIGGYRVNMQTPSTADIHNITVNSENPYHFSIDFKSL